MEFPFGHHNNHHRHRRDDGDDEPRPFPHQPPPPFSDYPPPSYGGPDFPHHRPQPDSYPPPPSFGGAYPHAPPPDSYAPPPPPPQVLGVHHSSHHGPSYGEDYPPPPPPPFAAEADEEDRHRWRPHMPGFMEGHFGHHNSNYDSNEGSYSHHGGGDLGDLAQKPTYAIHCKSSGDRYAVAIRNGKVILTRPDPNDPTQHWIKDERYSTKVKDADGFPSFSLVNKGTAEAVKHSVKGHPVQLIPYKPDGFDESILWTESKDLGNGFRTIRLVNNVKLVMDAFNGDKDHGGVHDGTVVALWECWKGDNQNQQWKLVRY